MVRKQRSNPPSVHIPLPDGLSLEFDGSHNWMLMRQLQRKAKDTGEHYLDHQILGYYPKPGEAARAALRYLLGHAGAQRDMRTFIRSLEVIEERLVECIEQSTELVVKR